MIELRNAILAAAVLGGTLGFSTLWSQPGTLGQEQANGPTIFRKIEPGGTFPTLDLLSLAGEPVQVEPRGERPRVVAFLRLDQEDSRRLLSELEALTLDPEGPKPDVLIVGMPTRREVAWDQFTKALPKRVTIHQGLADTATTLGVIVLPSIAVLAADGSLYRAHVLYDSELVGRVRREYDALASGRTKELDALERKKQNLENLRANANALEAKGRYNDALALRLQQQGLQADSARIQEDLGRTYLLLGDANKALLFLRKSIELEETVSARTSLGRALLHAGRLDEAERELMQVLPLTPRKAMVHRGLAGIHKRRGDLDKALEHIKAAIDAKRGVPAPATEVADEND